VLLIKFSKNYMRYYFRYRPL